MKKDFLKRYKPRIKSSSKIRKDEQIERLDRLSDAHRLGYNKAIEEFEKMLSEVWDKYEKDDHYFTTQLVSELKSKLSKLNQTSKGVNNG